MEYEIGLTKHGTIVGTLQLLLNEHTDSQIIQNTLRGRYFSMEGRDNKTGLQIIMENCFARQSKLESNNKISCILVSLGVTLQVKPDDIVLENIVVHFGLMNVFKIRRFSDDFPSIAFRRNDKMLLKVELNKFNFPTKLGELEFYNYNNIENDEIIMLNDMLPLITSGASIKLSKQQDYDISTIEKETREVIERLLTFSGFIQGCKQDWKFILIEAESKPVFIYIRAVKHSVPVHFPLDNGMQEFMLESLWNIALDLNKNNIRIALDWYFESLANQEFESKFLQMTTALECLLDSYHKENNSEYVLSKSDFSDLKQKIIPEIHKILKDKGLSLQENEEVFKTVEDSFQSVRRRTLARKFSLILNKLAIDCSDVKLRPPKISQIRNAITHSGQFVDIVNDQEEPMGTEKHYYSLQSAIIRILFKLLNYDGNYFDPYFKSLRHT